MYKYEKYLEEIAKNTKKGVVKLQSQITGSLKSNLHFSVTIIQSCFHFYEGPLEAQS